MKKSNLFFNTIGFRLSAIFCGGIMLLMALASIFYYTHQSRSLRTAFHSAIEESAENLAVNSAPFLLDKDEMQLSVLIATEVEKPEIISAGIVDRDGTVIIHSDINRIGMRAGSHDYASASVDSSNDSAFLVNRSIFLDGKKIGSVIMSADQHPLHRHIKNLGYGLLAAVSTITLTGCLIAVYVIGFFLNPLSALRDAAIEVGQGNFSVQIREIGGEEIKSLAQSFNTMTQKLAEANHRIKEGYLQSVMALSAAVEAKDPYTRGHCDRVAYYAEQIARQMGCSEKDIKTTQLAARLHDVGKIGVSEEVLGKPGRLTKSEFEHIARHPVIAWKILKPAAFLADVRDIVAVHHERFDGKGYPHGLSGKQICLPGRILALADSYDAMTTNRPYRNHLSVDRALEIIREERGKQFAPEVVDAFLIAQEHFRSKTSLDTWLEETSIVNSWIFSSQPQTA